MEGKYTEDAVCRARIDALEWLKDHEDGWPRSWAQLAANDKQRGYEMYDDYDFEAPVIAGYESLERDGVVTRHESAVRDGQERIHFRRTDVETVERALDKEFAD